MRTITKLKRFAKARAMPLVTATFWVTMLIASLIFGALPAAG
jgi:hypothetical protein